MKLSEMKQILADHNLRLTRSLGQSFLHDGNQLQRIIHVAELTRADRVLEIGPGLGPLTELLLRNAGEVLAIEKDARLVRLLEERFAVEPTPATSAREETTPAPEHPGRFRLVHEDALDLLRRQQHDWSAWKLVANLPYSVASPLLVELAQGGRGPQRIVATLQLEVARRLMAAPGQPDYGVLTLLLQLHYQPLTWFKIPAGCFFPQPDVDSACVCLARRQTARLPAELTPTFERLVKRSFSQRRKMMLKLLKNDWPLASLEHAFARLALPPTTRAEAVGLEQFVGLVRELAADSSHA